MSEAAERLIDEYIETANEKGKIPPQFMSKKKKNKKSKKKNGNNDNDSDDDED